jgi:hypothetical protein
MIMNAATLKGMLQLIDTPTASKRITKLTNRFGAARTGHTSTYIPAGRARRDE